jgi:hypothetical protein
MNKYLEKIAALIDDSKSSQILEKKAVRIEMYQHPQDKSKTKWVQEGKEAPFGYVKTKTSIYRKKGQKMGPKKSHK